MTFWFRRCPVGAIRTLGTTSSWDTQIRGVCLETGSRTPDLPRGGKELPLRTAHVMCIGFFRWSNVGGQFAPQFSFYYFHF